MTGPLPGLAVGLIDDLFDLVRRFGRAVQEGPYLFIAVTRPTTMLVRISAIFGDKQMYVLSRHDEAPAGVPCLIELGAPEKFVAWDCAVSVEDARAFIAAVDGTLRQHAGAFNSDGVRMRVDYDLSKRLFARSVDATFATAEDLMSVPRSVSLTGIRAQFDRPEKLVPFVDHFMCTHLCRLTHLDEIKRRDAAKMRVCMRWGIREREALKALPPDDLERLYKEFLHELERRPN